MRYILLYILQVIASSGLLYGYYHFFLRNRKFHQYNRYYLLVSAAISILVPFLNIPVYFSQDDYQAGWVQTLSGISLSGALSRGNADTNFLSYFTWERSFMVIYMLMILFLFSRLVIALLRIRSILRKYPSEKIEDVSFVNTEEKGTPFSFFRWMFWNKKISLQSENGQQMFRHELFHIRERHSWDTVLLELLTIAFWMNPFFYLMRREVKVIHEFLSDQFAIRENDQWNYAELLLMHLLETPHLKLTNPFFHNQIKRRIAMITSSKKPKYQYIRKVLVLPLLAIIAGLFAFTYKAKNVPPPPTLSITEVTLVDTVPSGTKLRLVAQPAEFKTVKDIFLTEPDTLKLREVVVEGHKTDNKGTEPLIVVNGKPLTGKFEKPLSAIDPNSIESISVLKGETALQRYGIKAVNGVVEVTTRDGKDNEIKFTASEVELALPREERSSQEEVVVAGYARNGTPPKFPGGTDELRRFLHKNVNSMVPVEAGAPVGNYTVSVLVSIDDQGHVTEVKPLTSLGYGMEAEVVRALSNSPEWIPATQNGKPVKGMTRQPVTFVVEPDAQPAQNEPVTVTGFRRAFDITEAAKLAPIYPNPASKTVTIPYSSAIGGAAEINIYNAKGNVEKSSKASIAKGANNLSVDVSGLATGVYFISVTAADNSSRTFKLIKN